MSDPIIVIDVSEVREGKLDELEIAIKELAEFVDTNEPRPIAYHVYLSDDGTSMTVFQMHPDPASMEFHMEVAGPAFAKFGELLRLSAIDIYGRPSDKLLEQLRRKSQMLGGASVTVHELHAGFTRIGAR